MDVHIKTLRTKLGECGELIETVRGVGYRLNAEGGSIGGRCTVRAAALFFCLKQGGGSMTRRIFNSILFACLGVLMISMMLAMI